MTLTSFASLPPVSMISLAFVSTLLAQPMSAQGHSTTCNDTSRVLQVSAGYHNSLSQSCQTVTFSVMGNSFSTPSSCLVGYSHYAGSVYACQGPLVGTNCDPLGHKITITNATDGACPDITGLVGGSFGSWSEVPAALKAALRCVDPTKTKTFDYSAKLTPCSTETATAWSGPAADSEGHPLQSGVGPVTETGGGTWEFLRTPSLLAKVSAETVGDPAMALIDASHPALEGARVTGEISVHYSQPGAEVTTRRSWIEGRMSDRGRFEFELTSLAENGGENHRILESVAFDGTRFVYDSEGSESALVYGNGYLRSLETARLLAGDLSPVFDWVVDPFDLPLYEGVALEAGSAEGSGTVLRRQVDTPGGTWFEEWSVDAANGLHHPTSYTSTDSLGRVRLQALFSNYQALEGGIWRPFHSEWKLFLDGEASGRVVTTELVIQSAAPLDRSASEVVGIPAENRPWLLWD